MNSKYTAGLFVVFLALAATAYYVGRDREPVDLAAGTATPTPAALFEFDASDVQELALDGDEGSATLVRVAGGWEVNGQPANDTVEGLVERLAAPRPIRTLPSDRDPETYGFATPTLTVTLKTQSGEERVLVYGDEAVVDAHVYVRLGGEGDIQMFSSGDWNTMRGWLTSPPYQPTATPEADSTPTVTANETAEATDTTAEPGPPAPDPTEGVPTEETSVAPPGATLLTPEEPRPPPTEPPNGATPGSTATSAAAEPSEAPTLAGYAP